MKLDTSVSQLPREQVIGNQWPVEGEPYPSIVVRNRVDRRFLDSDGLAALLSRTGELVGKEISAKTMYLTNH